MINELPTVAAHDFGYRSRVFIAVALNLRISTV
jgi:hypothetical protein